MYSGWLVKWKLNRPVRQDEKAAALPRQRQAGVDADDRGTLTAFNSTYAEFVDRRFRLRGGFLTFAGLLVGLIFVAFCGLVWLTLNLKSDIVIANMVITFAAAIGVALLWGVVLRKDFLTHTYYPVRFNRKTRQVYVFRDKRDGGILTMPWEQGFFHVGEGLRDKRLLDLRCHLLDGDIVKDTFATGPYFDRSEIIKGMWEFVRCYMDEGPEAANPACLLISAVPTWKNCYIFIAGSLRAYSVPARIVLSPLLLSMAGMRWLVLRTCKAPVWPQEIEDACRIEPGDPHRLPEPEYIGQFAAERERAKASTANG